MQYASETHHISKSCAQTLETNTLPYVFIISYDYISLHPHTSPPHHNPPWAGIDWEKCNDVTPISPSFSLSVLPEEKQMRWNHLCWCYCLCLHQWNTSQLKHISIKVSVFLLGVITCLTFIFLSFFLINALMKMLVVMMMITMWRWNVG